ncbi:hypothetical protein ACSBR1_004204 [Camellia fascicularis]
MATEEVVVTGRLSTTSAPGSPKDKVKFLCSHGGKILPRPADGHLKYVGGETRVVSVLRDISFSELMKKIASLCDGDVVLKYQLIPEDLDALVSVKSDEDLRHMLDEYDRNESARTPRLRAFLFPANPIIMDNQTSPMEPLADEQRYIDAINGIIRSAPAAGNISSASSSPKSPESCIAETNYAMQPNGYQISRITNMHKVQSSPSISSLNSQQHSPHSPNSPKQHSIPQVQNHHHHHGHGHGQQYYQNYQHHGYQTPRTQYPPERLVSVRSVGRAESSKYQVYPSPNNYYPVPIHNRGSMCYCSKCMHFDEYGAFVERKLDTADRRLSGSPPPTRSPL